VQKSEENYDEISKDKLDIHMSGYSDIIRNYTKKDATFLTFIYFYMFQAVSPPIIRSAQLYIKLQVLSTNTSTVEEMQLHGSS
jgi:hypothetical protein